MASRPTVDGPQTVGPGRQTLEPRNGAAGAPLEPPEEQKTEQYKHDLNSSILQETRISLLRQTMPSYTARLLRSK